jgi:hypothetical protein
LNMVIPFFVLLKYFYVARMQQTAKIVNQEQGFMK